MDDMEKSNAELAAYRAAGGTALVDAQPVRCGRMEEALVNASSRTGVHIIAVTGFHRMVFYEEGGFPASWTEQQLADLFESEVTKGMTLKNGRRIAACAGMIKAAIETDGVYADSTSERLFGAVAQAASISGAPVLIHTEPNADILEMIDFFGSASIAPYRLIICHMDRTRYDMGYHKEVLSTGANLCYDSVNRLKYLSHEKEIELIKAMIEAGFEEQLLLSLDTTNQRMRAYGADMGLDYILKDFITMLREHGVHESAIENMTAHNARKALRLE
jgi:phosphotriesterase-related protein